MSDRPNDAEPAKPDEPKDGDELAAEVRELREKNRDVETGEGAPGDPQAGGAGPGATSTSG